MNWHATEKHWELFRDEVKLHWSRLEDEDLNVIAGQRIHLLAKLRQVYGITHEQAQSEVQQFEQNFER